MDNKCQITIDGQTKISGVIGENISYSRSPLIHNYWYQQNNINGIYTVFNTTSDNFFTAVHGLFASGIIGLNITVPFKELSFEIADIHSKTAQSAQAANVLYMRDGKIYADNTDGFGFIQSVLYLKSDFDFQDSKVLIIGAGGASSAIVSSLLEQGVKHIDIINRTLDNAQKIADLHRNTACRITAHDDYNHIRYAYDLIVQTTSLKTVMTGAVNHVPEQCFGVNALVIDINYNTQDNQFLDHIKDLGCIFCDGTEMLIQQARPSFALFNQCDMPDVHQLRLMLGVHSSFVNL
jgi:shikimate dehydrogenase